MTLEVEVKYAVADPARLVAELASRGVHLGEIQQQQDRYFRHPVRDFAQTDEALRIRTVGGVSQLTYKGPKLDQTTKSRHEIELALRDPHVEDALAEMLELLGFQHEAVVQKSRREGELRFADRTIVIAVDELEELGTFLELETKADSFELDDARNAVLQLADELRLSASERRSYLELMLERRPSRSPRTPDSP